jgi:hypothetical protein
MDKEKTNQDVILFPPESYGLPFGDAYAYGDILTPFVGGPLIIDNDGDYVPHSGYKDDII